MVSACITDHKDKLTEHTSKLSSEPFIAWIVSFMFAMSCGLSTVVALKTGRPVDAEGVIADCDAIASALDAKTRISRE